MDLCIRLEYRYIEITYSAPKHTIINIGYTVAENAHQQMLIDKTEVSVARTRHKIEKPHKHTHTQYINENQYVIKMYTYK